MMRSLYTAATGMYAQQMNVNIIANNLANANTTSYKGERVNFQDLLYANMNNGNVSVGAGVKTAGTEKVFSMGSLEKTDNPLHAAINGNGFYRVELPDGKVAYTRDGNFHIGKDNELMIGKGKVGIKIPKDVINVRILKDGKVVANKADDLKDITLGQLKLTRFLNPAGLKSIGGNMYVETQKAGERVEDIPGKEGIGMLVPGYLEKSNVNVIEAMMNIVQAQRAYEMNSKGVQTADNMMRLINQLKR